MKKKELISYMDDKFKVEVPEFWDEIKDRPIDTKVEYKNMDKKNLASKIIVKKFAAVAVSLAIIISSGVAIYKSVYPNSEKVKEINLNSTLVEDGKDTILSFEEKLKKIPNATHTESPESACLAFLSLFYNGTHYKSPYWWNSRTYQGLDDYGKVNLINDLLGEELVRTTYSLGDNGNNAEGESSYWQVDGAANLAVGSVIYKVKGYDSKDIVMCLLDSNSKVPNIMFFCRDNFEEISLNQYKFNADNYIDNIKDAYQVWRGNNDDILGEIDVNIINNVLKSIKKSPEIKFEDHYKLYEINDNIKNAIDGMRGVKIITKDDVAIYLEVTNSGNVLIYDTWTAYKLEDEVWKNIWDSVPLEKIRDCMDRQGYNYIKGIYIPKDAPLDSPKIQEILNP